MVKSFSLSLVSLLIVLILLSGCAPGGPSQKTQLTDIESPAAEEAETVSGQWTPQTSGVGNYFNDVFFVNENTGWAVGNNEAILNTKDGGLTWKIQHISELGQFRRVQFFNENTGVVLVPLGIYKTFDGGANWLYKKTGSGWPEYSALYFIDENTGWIADSKTGGSIFKTTDGGENWIDQGITETQGIHREIHGARETHSFNDIYFIDANTGWAVGESGTIYKTTNGGANWTFQTTDTYHILYRVRFIDADTGWVVGSNGIILKTTNGGKTWVAQNSGTTNELLGLHFVNKRLGWVVGRQGTILITTNGGKNWVSQNSGTAKDLYGAYFVNKNTGWIIGAEGTILKFSS